MNQPLYHVHYSAPGVESSSFNLAGLEVEDRLAVLLPDEDRALPGVLATLADNHGHVTLVLGLTVIEVIAVEEER